MQGIYIQRERIRESLHRVDPSGVHSQMKRVLKRRVYQVECPNALWYLDGYHKLSRWRVVTHGGVDGYSRLITYLSASSNNEAESVLSAFCKAIEDFGLPSRVRTDKGGENVLVAHYMLGHPERGPNRGSIITGKVPTTIELRDYGRISLLDVFPFLFLLLLFGRYRNF